MIIQTFSCNAVFSAVSWSTNLVFSATSVVKVFTCWAFSLTSFVKLLILFSKVDFMAAILDSASSEAEMQTHLFNILKIDIHAKFPIIPLFPNW